jgi:prepilin-type N-terminal cleavage/methylation domain-containing protein
MQKMTAPRTTGSARRGFTLIELLLVLLIISLLVAVGVPVLSRLVKTSKVQQAIAAVKTALWQARTGAQAHQTVAAVFYGDDTSGLRTQPLDGVLPEKGKMEVWTVFTANVHVSEPRNVIGAGTAPSWYPYHLKDKCLTPQAISLPEGVRVLSGWYNSAVAGEREFNFNWTRTNPVIKNTGVHAAIGEIKRHCTPFWRSGNGVWQFEAPYLLIFEESTGEHVIVLASDQYGSMKTSRPRIVTRHLTHFCGARLATFADLKKLVDNYQN